MYSCAGILEVANSEWTPLAVGLYLHLTYEEHFGLNACVIIEVMGMTGFDGGGCRQTASREAPSSKNQRKTQLANLMPTMLFPLPHKPGTE